MDEILDTCNEKIALGNCLLGTLKSIENLDINGLDKLKVKIKKEIDFLIETRDKGLIKKEHVVGSNLNHFEALINYLLKTNHCTDVLKVFHFRPDSSLPNTKRVDVDVVSEKKKKWTKVIARNPKSLSLISRGEGGFGQKSIVDHADDYLECARQNTHMYKVPYVEFHFGSGVDGELASLLAGRGVHVGGRLLDRMAMMRRVSAVGQEPSPQQGEGEEAPRLPPDPPLPPPATHHSPSTRAEEVRKLNLDVTTMISYVSGLTNGRADIPLRGKMLQDQARMERERPLKPILDEIFKDKELYACSYALRSFGWLVGVMGGTGERKRAEELVGGGRVREVPDPLPPATKEGQPLQGGRSEAVFETGVQLGALTATANKSFVNSALMKGIRYEVVIHEPRGLSESKEIVKEQEDIYYRNRSKT